jgi:hypothetical protein
VGKIVVCSTVSIDGYTERRGGDVMALPLDEAFARHHEDRVRSASSFVFGPTYRGFLTYWPDHFTGPAGSYHQTTESTTAQRRILTRLDLAGPPRILQLHTA